MKEKTGPIFHEGKKLVQFFMKEKTGPIFHEGKN